MTSARVREFVLEGKWYSYFSNRDRLHCGHPDCKKPLLLNSKLIRVIRGGRHHKKSVLFHKRCYKTEPNHIFIDNVEEDEEDL